MIDLNKIKGLKFWLCFWMWPITIIRLRNELAAERKEHHTRKEQHGHLLRALRMHHGVNLLVIGFFIAMCIGATFPPSYQRNWATTNSAPVVPISALPGSVVTNNDTRGFSTAGVLQYNSGGNTIFIDANGVRINVGNLQGWSGASISKFNNATLSGTLTATNGLSVGTSGQFSVDSSGNVIAGFVGSSGQLQLRSSTPGSKGWNINPDGSLTPSSSGNPLGNSTVPLTCYTLSCSTITGSPNVSGTLTVSNVFNLAPISVAPTNTYCATFYNSNNFAIYAKGTNGVDHLITTLQ